MRPSIGLQYHSCPAFRAKPLENRSDGLEAHRQSIGIDQLPRTFRRGCEEKNEDRQGDGIRTKDLLHAPLPSHITGSRQESWGCQVAVVSKEEPRTSIWGELLRVRTASWSIPDNFNLDLPPRLRYTSFFAQGDPCATDKRRTIICSSSSCPLRRRRTSRRPGMSSFRSGIRTASTIHQPCTRKPKLAPNSSTRPIKRSAIRLCAHAMTPLHHSRPHTGPIRDRPLHRPHRTRPMLPLRLARNKPPDRARNRAGRNL